MDMHDAEHVFRDQRRFVERALRRFGVPERDVPDATQDVFVVVHRKLPTFEARSSVSTWIYRIAFHVASQHRRRACNRHEVLDDVEVTSALAVDHERRDLVERAIATLDELDTDKRDVFVDFELNEEPMATIAQRLGVPLKTAFSRLYAARRDLMRRMREGGVAAFWFPNTPTQHSTWSLSAATVFTAAWLLVSPSNVPTPLLLSSTHVIASSSRAPMFEVAAAERATAQDSHQTASRASTRRVTPATRAQPPPTKPIAEAVAESLASSLIVFRDSEAELAPSLPPPLLAELPPAAAREPRIQLRGQRDTSWRLGR